MRKSAHVIFGTTAAVVFASFLVSAPVHAQGKVPDDKVCKDEKALKQADVVTQGGCIVLHRRKGNCAACHQIAGTNAGNVAPPLVSMKQRYPDKSKLRAQIWDARQFNQDTVMPPFGAHKILTEDEVDKVVEFMLTL